jgi:copper chaperone CopZ
MFKLHVPDIKSEECAAKIRKAVAGVDDGAECDVDVDKKLVQVMSPLPPSDFVEAMEEAGYAASLFGAIK